jgi:phospholipid transport system substrate-binding protein
MVQRVVLALLLLGTAAGFAKDDSQATQQILEKTITRGLEILRNEELGDSGKLAAFDPVLAEACHLELMAKLALGRAGWTALSEAEQEEYVPLFADLLKNSYYGKISQMEVDGFAVEYLSNEATGRGKRSLKALMQTKASKVEVLYKFADRDGRWAIYDVELDGISLVASYRSQFNDYLALHSAQELLAELKSGDSAFAKDDDTALVPQDPPGR